MCRGHVRVHALSANQILSVPGLGDLQMTGIRAWLPSAGVPKKRGRDAGEQLHLAARLAGLHQPSAALLASGLAACFC